MTIDSEGNIIYLRMEDKNVDNHPSHYADTGMIMGCLILLVASASYHLVCNRSNW